MAREQLPNRRGSESFTLTASDGGTFTATTSRYPDGRLAEVFINSPKKAGNDADVNARDSAIVCSLALQHGATVDVILAALSKDKAGRPASILGQVLDALASGEGPS